MNLNPPGGNPPPGGPPRLPPVPPPDVNRAAAVPLAPVPDDTHAAAAGPEVPPPAAARPHPNARRDVMIQPGDQNRRDHRGRTALHIAIAHSNLNQVRMLLRLGANPNLQLPDQRTPLMLAIRYRTRNREIVQTLLDTPGLLLDVRDGYGGTALHHAAQADSAHTIALLVRAGADPFLVCSHGFNALHQAAHFGRARAVHALMDAMPGQWGRLTDAGLSAHHLAGAAGHADVVAAMAARPGCDINQLTASGHTVLYGAALNGCMPVLNALLGAPGLDVNARGADRNTPLQAAAERGHAEVVAALVAAPGIDVNAMTNGRDSALQLAVRHNHLHVLEELLRSPAINVNLHDRNGVTALMSCCPRSTHFVPKIEAGLRLLRHPDIDPNGAVLLISQSALAMRFFRQRAGVPESMPDQDFLMQELERWTNFVPRIGEPNRWATSMTNYKLGMLLHDTRFARPPPPAGARRDLGLRDAAFRITLALEQALQFNDGYCMLARDYARKLLVVAPREPDANPGQPDHYHNMFLIRGIDIPRSEIEDMAHVRGNYAMHGELDNIQQGWGANVHQPGFLLRGRDVLMHLQQRDVAALPLENAVATVRHCIDAMATDATASQRLQSVLHGAGQAPEPGAQPVSDAAKLAVANWIAGQPEAERAVLQTAWRARLIQAGLQQTLSQDGAVNEAGLAITAPETLRLLQSYIQSQSTQPGRLMLALQLQDAVLERLHDIGSDPQVCNTGCVQRLLDAPAGIDDTLMAREPHDRAIYDEILRIGSTVNRAFDEQYPEIIQPIDNQADQQNYDDLSAAVRRDILSATAIDDLVRRRGWSRTPVEVQLQAVLHDLENAGP